MDGDWNYDESSSDKFEDIVFGTRSFGDDDLNPEQQKSQQLLDPKPEDLTVNSQQSLCRVMGHKGDGTIEMAALGRPFSLGMLYDCRHEKFIPGMTLWNYDDLVNHIGESPLQHSDFEIVASESIEDKSAALNVEGSLKASLFFGLIEGGGSAKYLRDNRTFKNQARVTLKYEATTKFQELSMNHLGIKNVKHPDVFTKGIATHVVTAILYGAQAFFVFDREVSDMINREEAEGFLRGMMKKIPFLKTEGDLSLKLEEKDFKKVEEFSCKFHGDFLLEKTPSTFKDAIQVYQSLPKLLGPNGENAVPVKVWLLPLTSLDPSATKFVYEISDEFVKKVQAVLEDFSELEMRCNDILRATAQQFSQIGKKIETFKEMCSEFRLKFQSNLAKELPSIRGGGEEEAELAEILKKRHSSPFNSKDLNEWMDCKEKEISNLKSITDMMKNTKIVPSQTDLYKEILSAEHAVCFVFTSLGSAEPFLSALSNYLTETPKPDEPRDPHTDDVEREQWYTSKEVLDAISHKAKLFSDFAEANKEKKNVKFLTVGSANETHKGSSIYLYKDGRCVNENFKPPSKSETMTVTETDHKSVTLKISPPQFGAENITSYSVEYCVSGDDGWKQKTASEAEEVTVSDLSPNTEYMFRCRAVTSAGVGPANEVSGSIKTLPCSPPGKPQVEQYSSEISVSWEKPAELGQNVNILSYIVEYANKDNSMKEEDLQWSQKTAGAERVIISGLQPETEYVVRVRCDCGGAGGSKESITVTVCTTQDDYVQALQDVLKDLTDLEIRCKDAINSTTVKQFPQIAQKIETFKKLCTDYKLTFPQRLTILRGESKAVVMDMMKMRNSSPYNETDLCKWMDCKEREISNLKSFTDMMKNTNIVPSQNHLYKEIHSAEHAVCFVFTSLGSAEPFLSALSNYLKQTSKTNDTKDPHTDDVEREQWYTSKEVLDAISHKAKLFSDFAEANKENKNVKFLTVGSTNETHKGSSIYLYKDGFSVSENFEPPSKPETVTVTETNHKSVTLKISPPKFGAENITSYSVEYCVSGDDGWKQKTASEAEEVTVSDLSPNTEHMFRCRAVTSAGVGPANEVSGSIKTLPCSPPGKPQVEQYSSEISLSWEKPAELGQNVHILSYIVEYANKDKDMKEEDLQWSQIMTKDEKVIISDLQPETEYVVRVRCDCGEAGGSKESITVTVCTTQDVQVLQDILKDLTDLEIRCKDAINSTTVKQFPQIAQKIETFKKLCTDYKLTFPQRLTILRGESKAVVMDMMKMRNSSPFNETDLCKWMDCKETEIYILKSFTDIMQNTNIVPSQDAFQREIVSAEHAVCFVFTSLGSAEPFLSALSNYLTETPKPDEPRDPHTDDVEREQWYLSDEVKYTLRNQAKLFSDFAEANKENNNIKFLTVGSANETHKGSSIYLYKGYFEPPSKPETVTVTETNHNTVTLKISPPKFGAENITSYSVEYCVSGDDGWKQKTASEAEEVTVSDLSPNTEHMFRCRAVTSAGVGPANEVSGSIKTLPCSPPGKPQVEPKLRQIKRLADAVKEKSAQLKPQTGSLPVYKVPLKEEQINVPGCKCFSFGKWSSKPNRTIMVLGATGAGKSTLINGMINYILGVEWEDSYRFQLVDEGQSKSQAHSQTSDVTVYKLNHQEGFKIEHSLTIVDTPGFGDTRSIERDKEILHQLSKVYCDELGVSEVDAICFVAQAALTQLTPSQEYVFESMLSIFGKDVAENIRVLVTFADGMHPAVLEAINASGVPCPKTEDGLPVHFKFNNSALFTDKLSAASSMSGDESEEDGHFEKMFWDMGAKSMKTFFVALNVMKTKRLATPLTGILRFHLRAVLRR